MKKQLLTTILIGSAAVLVAQPPPPPSASPTASTTATGSIEQFNYGPDGRVQGMLIAPNTLVSLPPDWALQVEILAKPRDQVRAIGAVTPTASGMQVMTAGSLSVAGKTLSVAQVSQPAPYAGSGVICSLNYGPGGEVNGFVLQNGIVALTPPIGTSDVSVVKRGANLSFSGFARVTASGRAVVRCSRSPPMVRRLR